MTTPFNLALHEFMMAQGASYERVAERTEHFGCMMAMCSAHEFYILDDVQYTVGEDGVVDRVEFRPAPFNLALHEHLTQLGFHREVRQEACWEDTGDAESGPSLSGHPAYDQYTGPRDLFFVDEHGHFHHEVRDLEMEAYVEAMGIECDAISR